MELTMARTPCSVPSSRSGCSLSLPVAMIASAIFVGSQRQQPPLLVRNGVIALEKDGDIFVADRPGGDLVRCWRSWTTSAFRPGPAPRMTGTRLRREMSRPRGLPVLARRHEARLHAVDRRPTGRLGPDDRRCRRHERRPGRDGSSIGAESRSGWSFAPDGRSLMAVAQIAGAEARRDPPGRPGSGTHRPGHPAAGRLDGDRAIPGSARRTPRRSSSWRSWSRTVRRGALRVRPCDGRHPDDRGAGR